MTIAIGIAIYLGISFLVCFAFGSSVKRYRADSMGISLEEDTRLQDEAQLAYLRGETINVIDHPYRSRAERLMGLPSVANEV